MPALKIFGRRWGIASDDVVLTIPPLIFHFVWTIVIPVRPQHPHLQFPVSMLLNSHGVIHQLQDMGEQHFESSLDNVQYVGGPFLDKLGTQCLPNILVWYARLDTSQGENRQVDERLALVQTVYFGRVHRPEQCSRAAYEASIYTLYALTVASFAVELGLLCIGLQGALVRGTACWVIERYSG